MVVLQRRVAGMTEAVLTRFVARARRFAGLKGAVNVLVTSNSELRSLNRRFRGKDQPTDVLSFAAEPGAPGDFAGDIAISAEIALQNARRLGHATAAEIKILVLHGILHLRGYDHDQDPGPMAKIEERLRRKLRLPTGLIERAVSREGNVRRAGTARRRP